MVPLSAQAVALFPRFVVYMQEAILVSYALCPCRTASQPTGGRTDVASVPNKRQTIEIQVTHVGPDLQFATAEVTKSAKGLGSSSDGR